jgi:gas vesicle protein
MSGKNEDEVLEEAAMEHEDHRARTFLAGLAIGALVGAGVALLFAPQSGAETRRVMSKKAKTLAKEAREKYEAMREKVKHARHHEAAGAEDDDLDEDA